MNQYWHHPNIDPVLLNIWGPFQIRWYSLLYVGGFLAALYILRRLARDNRFKFTPDQMEQLVVWGLVGAVIGARIVYCFVYDPIGMVQDPFYLFKIYQGGLSFHGGLIGVIVAMILFARKNDIPFWNLADAVALASPPGLAMGRLGNFINGELYGRVTDVPWALVFRGGGPQPRHPSQLYEFFMEGVLLFAVLWIMKSRVKTDGVIALTFLFGYSLARFIVEFYRQPDSQVGYLLFNFSMGQWLSIVMLVASAVTAYVFVERNKTAPVPVKRKKS